MGFHLVKHAICTFANHKLLPLSKHTQLPYCSPYLCHWYWCMHMRSWHPDRCCQSTCQRASCQALQAACAQLTLACYMQGKVICGGLFDSEAKAADAAWCLYAQLHKLPAESLAPPLKLISEIADARTITHHHDVPCKPADSKGDAPQMVSEDAAARISQRKR